MHLFRLQLLLILGLSAFCSAVPLDASDRDEAGRAPYNVLYFDFGFGGFTPMSSSASAPTQDCHANGFAPSKACAEHFSGTPSIDFGLGVRPLRYLQAGFGLSVLGNFGGYGNYQYTYQCVGGCTGTQTRSTATRSLLLTSDAMLVLPLFREHLAISAGGGIGWLQISQSVQAQGNEQLQGGCPDCQSARAHGPTEVAEVVYFPSRFVGFGFHYRGIQVGSPGLSVYASSPPSGGITFRDRFSSVGGTVTFRLGTRRH